MCVCACVCLCVHAQGGAHSSASPELLSTPVIKNCYGFNFLLRGRYAITVEACLNF